MYDIVRTLLYGVAKKGINAVGNYVDNKKIDKHNDYVEAYNIGLRLTKECKTREAIPYLEKALSYFNDNKTPYTYYCLGLCYEDLGDYSRACSAFYNSLNHRYSSNISSRQRGGAYFGMAICKEMQNDSSEALSYLKQAYTLIQFSKTDLLETPALKKYANYDFK